MLNHCGRITSTHIIGKTGLRETVGSFGSYGPLTESTCGRRRWRKGWRAAALRQAPRLVRAGTERMDRVRLVRQVVVRWDSSRAGSYWKEGGRGPGPCCGTRRPGGEAARPPADKLATHAGLSGLGTRIDLPAGVGIRGRPLTQARQRPAIALGGQRLVGRREAPRRRGSADGAPGLWRGEILSCGLGLIRRLGVPVGDPGF